MRNSSLPRLIGTLAVLALALFACGDAVEVAVDAEPGSADIQIDTPGADIEISAEDEGETVVSVVTPEGSGLITSGTGVPEEFPLAIAPGCQVVSSSSVVTPDGTAVSVVLELEPAEAESVAAFYEREFERLGMEVVQTVTAGDGGDAIMLMAVNEARELSGNLFLQVSGEAATATITVGGSG